MKEFSKYNFLFPPRPEKAIPYGALNFYEKQGFVAQHKKNGTCTVLYVTPEKEIIARTRHDDDHKLWSPTEKSSAPFKALKGKGWFVFATEVLHSKVKGGAKDTVYIFDILVNDGETLTGKTFAERQEILKGLFPNRIPSINHSHYVITENVWLAKVLKKGFKEAMDRIQKKAGEKEGAPEDEGLVLKRPDAPLASLGRATSNSGWQVKCRVLAKNYSF